MTVENDTIDCKVTRNNAHFIYFRIAKNGMAASGKISRLDVKQLILNVIRPEQPITSKNYRRWRIAISGGATFRLADTGKEIENAMERGLGRDDADNYYEQLSQGWQTGADFSYFLDPRFAAGLSYRFFHLGAASWLTRKPPLDDTHNYYGKMSETTYLNYAGISLLFRQPVTPGEKLHLTASASGGMVFYRNEASVLGSNLLITANAPALNAELGMEYLIKPGISIGLSTGFFGAKIKKINRNDGQTSFETAPEREDQKNLNSLDLSAGLRFHF